MSSILSGFVQTPSEVALELCTKEQLIEIADHYKIEIDDGKLKESVKARLKQGLREIGVLWDNSVSEGASFQSSLSLTFEQQRELLQMQLEIARLRNVNRPEGVQQFDVSQNLRLLPKFDESDPDTYFTLFDRIAEARAWSDLDMTMLLQCALTGKAREAFSALSVADSKVYAKVKSAVLKVYELVPEAYRQRFRYRKKQDSQTYSEFVRDLTSAFNRWCTASEASTFEDLSNLIVLEQFKNSVSDQVATYINERKVKSPSDAAVLADEHRLTHKSHFESNSDMHFKNFTPRNSKSSFSGASFQRPQKFGFGGPKAPLKDNTCRYCLVEGHWKKDCPLLRSKKLAQAKPAVMAVSGTASDHQGEFFQPKVEFGSQSHQGDFSAFVSDGVVSLVDGNHNVPIRILRDTGALDSFILESILPFSKVSDTGSCVMVRGMGLVPFSSPLHVVTLKCGLVAGDVAVGVRPQLPVEGIHMILGNDLAGSKVWADGKINIFKKQPSVPPAKVSPEYSCVSPEVFPGCAVTRSAALKKIESKPESLELPVKLQTEQLTSSRESLIAEQKADTTLTDLFDRVVPEAAVRNNAQCYFLLEGLLVRKWVPHSVQGLGEPVFQIVVPTVLRNKVLQTSHGEVAGHMGVRKTYDRILRHFFWPRLKRAVAQFIKTCPTCQRTSKPNQVVKPAPLYPIPAIGQPFEHLIIDCVGPLPRSKSGHNYLLTVMCHATRYPAAFPLRTITSKAVVKALTQFISTFGIPKIIQSDRGSNFTSHLFAQVLKQLKVKHNKSTAFHAQSQGALERFHQTLKSLLRSYCTELSADWEEGLPWLLLSAREVVQESTGFSPNDLVFGHKVRGPLAVLQDGCLPEEPPRNLIDYVNGFRLKLYRAGELAKEKLKCSQKKMKLRYDRQAELREFTPGDRVLALLPLVSSPFQAKYCGPFNVLRKVSDLNYLIETPGYRKSSKLCHVNLLKCYHSRDQSKVEGTRVVKSALTAAPVTVSCGLNFVDGGEEEVIRVSDEVLQGRLKNSQTLQNLGVLVDHLDLEKRDELVTLIRNYNVLFSDTPSQTHLLEHDIDIGDAKPIKQRFYRVPEEKRLKLETEVQYMLDNGIAEPCCSDWASPCLLVKKSDSTFRPCTDYRKINNVTKADLYPLPRMEDCIDQVGSAKFVSKFDLLKGYWQVPLTKRAGEIAAFITPFGLFSYTVMPFGLRNAPATFQRLMNRVVSGLEGCAVYLDDVVVYSDSWEEHICRVQALFQRLVWARLTINLAKCEFAKATVTYLGKVVGQGFVCPVEAKVQAVKQFPQPSTKKELMRFLGMAGYYRAFCKNFSVVVSPLTNLLKAKAEFIWSTHCQEAFDAVKALLCLSPVLAAPNFEKPFKLQVDASQIGAGAVLLQENDDQVECPVSFFSRKFNKYQQNYSVIEKEALGLIWALQHFEVYVGSGLTPLTVFTDHNPLIFLKSLQNPNQRLMRWALFLQPFNLDIRHISGKDNIIADALSRAPVT